jgi:hypothetical protein
MTLRKYSQEWLINTLSKGGNIIPSPSMYAWQVVDKAKMEDNRVMRIEIGTDSQRCTLCRVRIANTIIGFFVYNTELKGWWNNNPQDDEADVRAAISAATPLILANAEL